MEKASALTLGDASPKRKDDSDLPPPPPTPPPPAAAKLMNRFPTKWKQLTFSGAKTSPSKSSASSSTTAAPAAPAAPATTTTTNPPIQSPSPSPVKKNSRKAPSSPSTTTSSPAKKRSRPSPSTRGKTNSGTNGRYAPPSKYASINNLLTDSITPNLFTLFIGLNPGLQTATSGHAYAHPSNLFWRLLHRSGCTPRQCHPCEDGDMPRLYNLGLTNIVTRPTRDGAELSKAEMDEGVAELERKIALYKPESVTLVGKSIWESVWRVKHGRGIKKEEFRYGWQGEGERMGKGTGMVKRKGGFFGGTVKGKEGGDKADADADEGGNENDKGEDDKKWMGARVFVASTTSGLAASMSVREKEEIWAQLGSWVEERRAERKKAATALKESELGSKSELELTNESELVAEEQAEVDE